MHGLLKMMGLSLRRAQPTSVSSQDEWFLKGLLLSVCRVPKSRYILRWSKAGDHKLKKFRAISRGSKVQRDQLCFAPDKTYGRGSTIGTPENPIGQVDVTPRMRTQSSLLVFIVLAI